MKLQSVDMNERLRTLLEQDGYLEIEDGTHFITAHNAMTKSRIVARAEQLGESIKWSGLTGILR